MDLRTGSGDESLGPRLSPDVLTEKFRLVWPDVEEPLRRYVASLGAQRADVDDIVQEVAARALHRRVWFADAADLRRWSFVVARRVRIDQLRAAARVRPLDAVAATTDAHASREFARVEDRHVLRRVQEAIASLPPADHRALTELASVADAAARNRAAVARHRARARLRRIVGPVSAALGWLVFRRDRGVTPVLATVSSLALVVTVLYGSPPSVAPSAPDIAVRVGTAAVTPARILTSGKGPGRSAATAAATPSRSGLPHEEAVTRETRPLPMVRAHGPAHAWLTAGLEPNNGHRPIVCIEGLVVGRACVLSPAEPVPTVHSQPAPHR